MGNSINIRPGSNNGSIHIAPVQNLAETLMLNKNPLSAGSVAVARHLRLCDCGLRIADEIFVEDK